MNNEPGVYYRTNFDYVPAVELRIIDSQTIHFWHLQLQFLSMSPVSVLHQLSDLFADGVEFKSLHVTNMVMNFDLYNVVPPCKDEYKLATELALQLSGIEE